MNLIEELFDFISNDDNFNNYHSENLLIGKLKNNIKDFLFATLDEVRLRFAEKITKQILYITDIDDAAYFRNGLIRKEVTGEFIYSGQRDHSVHTLYNYLMGWYIFSHNKQIKTSLEKHFKQRVNDYGERGITSNFAEVWPFVSLLHDIGYLFEGSLDFINPDIYCNQLQTGINIVTEFFQHRIWEEAGFDSIFDRELIKKNINNLNFDLNFNNNSFREVFSTLRYLGNIKELYSWYIEECRSKNLIYCNEEFIGDAFELWKQNYQFFENTKMYKQLELLRQAFIHTIDEGRPDNNLRIFNHGICSGLILLLFSTRWYLLYRCLTKTQNSKLIKQKEKFEHTIYREHAEWDPLWWWGGIVWATAATAIHDLQQDRNLYSDSHNDIPKLNLDDDPLAYLGILVDCIQEWDRSTIRKVSTLSGPTPIQGKDMALSYCEQNDQIVVNYFNENVAKKIRKELNNSLNGWNQILLIKS